MWLKISGRIESEKKIEIGDDVWCVIAGSCIKKEIMDNQDGSVDMVFVIKPTAPIAYQDEMSTTKYQ